MSTLILNDIQPWHWAMAGGILGAMTLLLLYMTNVRFGMSTGFESACSLFSSSAYFQRPKLTRTNLRRLLMFVGLVVGGAVSAVMSGGWQAEWSMGRFDTVVSDAPAVKLAWMFFGGLLVGFGTRLGSGCTGGHAVFGVPNMDRASIRAVLAFMGAGILTANLIYRVIFA